MIISILLRLSRARSTVFFAQLIVGEASVDPIRYMSGCRDTQVDAIVRRLQARLSRQTSHMRPTRTNPGELVICNGKHYDLG